jgi:MFS family permease
VSDRRRWIALVVLCLGQLMIVLDATIVNVALPSIQHDLHFTQASLTWVVNAYLIAFGSFLLLAGRLGDLAGRKKVFLGGLAVFTTASALCGLADSQGLLIGARFLQGIGGAVASSVIIAIIVTEFPARGEQAKALGVFSFVASAGGSIGLLAGGVITHAIDWHWIFFINVPIGVAAIALGAALVEENEGAGLRQGVDVFGAVLMTAATMLAVYAIVGTDTYGWGSARTLGLGAVALAGIGAFLAYEARVRNPIMPLRVLRSRSLTGANLVRGFLVIGMFSAFFLGALYLEHVLGYDPVQTGLAFLPMTLAIGALSVAVTPRLLTRFGAKRTGDPQRRPARRRDGLSCFTHSPGTRRRIGAPRAQQGTRRQVPSPHGHALAIPPSLGARSRCYRTYDLSTCRTYEDSRGSHGTHRIETPRQRLPAAGRGDRDRPAAGDRARRQGPGHRAEGGAAGEGEAVDLGKTAAARGLHHRRPRRADPHRLVLGVEP